MKETEAVTAEAVTAETRRPGFARRRAITQSPGEVVRTRTLYPGASLLVVEPGTEEVDLPGWGGENRALVESLLLRHGALLFRGFGMGEVERFESFASVICPNLFEENGEHPRQSVGGRVYTPVFYPSEQRLLWHNENSFNLRWPKKILFACARPADSGGATPVVNSREVYRAVEPDIRERFERKGTMYVRNYGGGLGLDWQTVFRTDDRAQVEARCRAEGMEYEWKSDDRLRTRCVRPAVIEHPLSGEPSWFTQAQHWHVSCLDRATRASVESLFDEPDWPRHCYYGDGTPIADAEMDSILAIYERLQEVFEWERGDVLLLDNVLTAHGRAPYTGERKILVAMGELGSFQDRAEGRR